MCEILTKEQLFAKPPGTFVQCVLYLKSYELSMTKTNKPFFKGCFYSHGLIDFKAWDSKKAYVQLQDLHQLGVLVKVSGTVEVYNGISSVVVEEVEQIPETESCNRFLFFEDVYQSDVYWETLQHLIQEGCSDNAQFVFRILMDDEEVRNSFRTEFAAVNIMILVKVDCWHIPRRWFSICRYYDNILKFDGY